MSRALILALLVVLATACTNYKTTDALNVRKGAGTNYAVVRTAAKGSTLCVVSITNGWAKLSDGNFASSTYLTKVETTPSCTNYQTTADLNVRKGAGTGYAVVRTAAKGSTLCVVSITNGWALLADNNFASSTYLTKSGSTPTPSGTACSGGKTSSCTTITATQMKTLFPRLSTSQSSEYAGYLNAAFVESSINTKLRIVHFLAQVGHESGGLYYFEEIASGAAYEGRTDLGNTQPGDGVRFKGRGPIQITGRYNYKTCGDYLGVDFINNPTWLALPKYGFRGAAWFWKTRSLNTWADQDDITTVTKKVNGGTNGLTDRKNWLAKAKSAYGI